MKLETTEAGFDVELSVEEYTEITNCLVQARDFYDEIRETEERYEAERREFSYVAEETRNFIDIDLDLHEEQNGVVYLNSLDGSHIAAITDALQSFGKQQMAYKLREKLL